MQWALPEWVVLALVAEEPRHGFAIAALTAEGGPVGRVWQIPRQMIYRSIGRLETAGLLEPRTVESGPGPQRTVYQLTPEGRAAAEDWLRQPVVHVRELRSHLLLKLALLDRRGIESGPLLKRQQEVLEPIVEALATARKQDGFDAVLRAWRYTNAAAALRFVEDLL
ncbi:PadR family transcriptional regulator [Actinocrispum sp. NPDC049592]|uniref:PadR family transcriptional regulator n=1 Tax=Actinocrispum sp. NPDC049592 TaxID=3154835 RepID=UPI003417A1D9